MERSELLGDDRECRARRLSDPQRQVSGLRPMATTMYQRLVDARVLHEVAHQLGADVPGGLEAERGNVLRQGKIVVDGLRDVHGADSSSLAAATWLDESAVSSPPIVIECVTPAASSVAIDRRHRLRSWWDCHARCPARSRRQMDARDIVDAQLAQRATCPPASVTEAVRDAQDLEASVDRLDGGRGDDRIDARRRSAGDQDCQCPR